MQSPPPLAIFAAFAIGLEAIVGLSLGLSNGLSETHKSVLVTFIVAFPALTLFLFVNVLPRTERADIASFRSRNAAFTPEPLDASVNRV